VTAIEIVNSQGEVCLINKTDEEFEQYLFSFGLLGVVTRMQFEVVPTYFVRKCIYYKVCWDYMLSDSDELDRVT
jgi:alditol oxidase